MITIDMKIAFVLFLGFKLRYKFPVDFHKHPKEPSIGFSKDNTSSIIQWVDFDPTLPKDIEYYNLLLCKLTPDDKAELETRLMIKEPSFQALHEDDSETDCYIWYSKNQLDVLTTIYDIIKE